jgi:hypothetical protein
MDSQEDLVVVEEVGPEWLILVEQVTHQRQLQVKEMPAVPEPLHTMELVAAVVAQAVLVVLLL